MPSQLGRIRTPAGTATVISLTSFFTHVLPPLRHGLNAEHTVKTLQSPSSKAITKRGRWRGFPVDPHASLLPAERLLTHFQAAFDNITESDLQPSLRFFTSDTYVTTSVARGADALPDVYLSTGSKSWDSIAVCGEFKQTRSPVTVSDVSRQFTEWCRGTECAAEHHEGDI